MFTPVKALHSFYNHFGALYTWWSFSLFGHGAFQKGHFSTRNLMRDFSNQNQNLFTFKENKTLCTLGRAG